MRSSLTDNALSFVRLFRFTPVLLIIVIITILQNSTLINSVDNLGLLMATLMTHKQINCIDKPITLHCPSGTNVIVQVARYVKFPSIKKSAVDICDEFGIVMEIDVDRKTESCQWYNSLEYSLLQTAVEACRSKERCQFQTSPLKFGIHPCSNDSTFVQVNYNCRPHSFNSRIGCEHEKINFECEPRTRLAIFSASYGRTQYQSVQCPQPQGVAEETCLLRYATEIVIDRCHGKKNCTLVADSKTFGKPCKEKSRVYLKVVYACVPRKVLLEKYEEEPDSTEYSFLEEVDQEDILDNPKSLAPSPNITNKKNYDNGDKSNAILLYHSPSENDYEYNYKEMKEKLYVYLIGGLSGITISIVLFIIVRLTWKRKFNDVNLRESSVENKSVEHSLKEVISEVDADVTLAVVLPPVTPMPPNHYISSPREVVRYGKENITPRSLYQDDENHFYYD